ncbi:glycoside hydrolase family 66 protein [uncultured Actinomyces sp.]|uniref:glycoside hydrolase family 66 protein n=1 Tax=uncultured Actinomyces sp. TaxID=249061 RepID=UPI0028E193A8|nr:glycoside hydrolase family 66 protein [uncultured Actinomyces sp.]
METRHPLTIPAALVLGTAIAATALPLPRFAPATASGTAHVTRAYTDKSTHSPGSQATITAEASGGGTVHFSVSHLGAEIDSGDTTVENGKATWTYTTPSENNQGYLVTATGADDTHAETALDVSSSWTRFPRMGYVSHFKPTAPADITTGTSYESYLSLTPSEYIAKLSQDYHINALQYYDWQYRHEQPVATGDLADKWPLWYRDTYASKKTITDYIKDAKNANMGSLAYSMAYAANDNYDTNTIKDEWRLREDNGSYWVRDLGEQWWVPTPKGVNKPKSHQFMMNVNTQGWRDYITDQYVTQKDAFGFDGTHIDTLGQTVKKDASGNSVDLTDGLTALVNETASKTGTATGINLPDGAGTDKIGPSSASYIYTELWDHNETNQQVASYLQGARDKSANKPQIVAAYANNYDPASWVADPSDSNKQIHPQVTPDEGTRIEAESDQASVSGGAHILSGDDSASGGAYAGDFSAGGSTVTFTIDAGQGGTFTFTTRYARQDDDPAYHQMILDMGQPTQKLIKYVHFDQTGSYYTWKDMTETVELTPGVHTISYWVPNDKNYTPVNIDCITFREFNSASVKLADAAFAANGAHHLELGDYGRMLDNEFFVNSGRSMSPDLQAWMKNYYNISTAYENLLYGDHLTRQERQVEVSTGGVSLPTSTDGAANTIWANTMTSDAGTALHLINLRTNDQDGNDEYWRNTAKQTLPFGDTSVTYHLAAGEPAPASVFVVSPDNDGGRPTQLNVTLGTDEQGNATVTFNVGWLSTWDMAIFSPSKDADRAGAEASASEAVTGQVRNGLGQCLSAQDAQAANGTPVWNSDCDAQGTAEQTVTYQDNHLMIGGRCVDVLANDTADGSVVHLWDCYPALPSQQWDRNDAGQYVNRGSGTCLTIPNDTTTTSTQAIIAQCSSSSPSQRWSAPAPAGQ